MLPTDPFLLPLGQPQGFNREDSRSSTTTSSTVSKNLLRFSHREKPTSDSRYYIENVARAQWLNLAYGNCTEGNKVLSWYKGAINDTDTNETASTNAVLWVTYSFMAYDVHRIH